MSLIFSHTRRARSIFYYNKIKGNGRNNIYLDISFGREISQEQEGIIKKGRILAHVQFNSTVASILPLLITLIFREETSLPK